MASTFLIETAAKGTVALAIACIAAATLRRAPAAVRAQVWAAAFIGLLALPALTAFGPSLRLPVLTSWAAAPIIARTSATAAAPVVSNDGAIAPPSRAGDAPVDWVQLAGAVWILGTAAMLCVFAFGWAAAARIRRRAIPFSSGLDLDVRLTTAGGAPMQVGVVRPTILLPLAAREWPPERLRVVLLHERAHIDRRDLGIQSIARIALALHWWNPLAWFVWRELLRDRERAADDAVVRSGAQPSEYASHLLEIAREMRAGSPLTLAAAAMARETSMEDRFAALLDHTADRRPATTRHACAAALAAVCLIVPLAASKAQTPSPGSQKANEALARRDYDAARKAVDAEIAAMTSRSGPAYARALVKAGDIERRRARRAAAAELYKQALTAAGDSPETAPALLALGQWGLADRHLDESLQLLERAERADPGSAARAVVWQALVRERQGDIPAADALYTRALALAPAESPDRPTVISLYRRFLESIGRAAEASGMQLPTRPTHVGSGVHRIGAGITAPKLVSKEEPAYTDEARIAKLDGTVVLYVEIAPDGRAQNMRVVKPLGLGLEENAIDAVSRWRFQPGTQDGQPVTVSAQIEVNFRLL